MKTKTVERKHVCIQQLPLSWWCCWCLIIATKLLICCSWTHAMESTSVPSPPAHSETDSARTVKELTTEVTHQSPMRTFTTTVRGKPLGDVKSKIHIAITRNFPAPDDDDILGAFVVGSNGTINKAHGRLRREKTMSNVAMDSSRNTTVGLASRTNMDEMQTISVWEKILSNAWGYAATTIRPERTTAITSGRSSSIFPREFNNTEEILEYGITFYEECLDHRNSLAQVFTVALYSLVCVVGLCGNTLVIWVVFRFSKMQTVTNIYILNLAIADECFLIGIPFLLYTMHICSWKFGEFACKAYMVSTSITQFTSSLFLLIMAADRYLAVCHPIESPRYRTIRIAKLVSMIAWVTSAILMMPVVLFASTVHQDDGINYSCNIDWPEGYRKHSGATFIAYTFLLGFAIPLCFIMVFYYLVIRKLHSVQQKHKSKEKKRSHRKVTRLVLTVITVYVFCWLPHWVSQMSSIYSYVEHREITRVEVLLFLLFGLLAYSNSAMNPILYAFLSDNFRKSFTKAFSCVTSHEVEGQLINENSVVTHKRSGSAANKRKASRRMSVPRTGPATQNNCFLAATIVHNSGGGSSSSTSASTATTATDKSSNSNNQKPKGDINGGIICTATSDGEKITLVVNHETQNENQKVEKPQSQTNV
ncbi:allatostatin C receptor 1 [Haematobia irritans]|uniref:allatostatin C receptor 1 n=1 Tax=Haematobia irritans TaxID=7368 RepID=UPI003F50059C